MGDRVEEYDVVIVGAGPAGYMAATWFARIGGLRVKFIEKRDTKLFVGQADGLQSRTLEVMHAFGFGDRVWKESNHMNEMCFWNPDASGTLVRTGRVPDQVTGISRFQQVVLHQGYIEQFYKDHLVKHDGALPEFGVMPESLTFDEDKFDDSTAYPITMTLKHLDAKQSAPNQFGHKVENGLFRSTNLLTAEEEDAPLHNRSDVDSSVETIRTKYVIGSDGAHSWVRRQLGFVMEGEQTDYVWGVMDIVPLTNFPDIRMRCAIHSANHGSVMVIPRERKLVRLYVQMQDVERDVNGRVDRNKVTPELLLASAQRIMSPYTLEIESCDWFTCYQIGQRVTNHFEYKQRVFIAGDACHTHSPKAGQGMNVSMMDTYNLGWKIAQVALGQLHPKVLSTYESERRKVAQDLIQFDQKFSKLFSGKPSTDDDDDETDGGEAGISVTEFQDVFKTSNLFACGIAVNYQDGILINKGDGASTTTGLTVEETASRIIVGMRMPSFQILNQSDARPVQLQDLLVNNGRWRLLVFAGNPQLESQMARIQALGRYLADSPTSFTKRYARLFETLTIHSGSRTETELSDFPNALRPMHDYWKLYVDDVSYHQGFGDAYRRYGIDRTTGCLLIVRPDQHIAMRCDLEKVELCEAYCDAFMIPMTSMHD